MIEKFEMLIALARERHFGRAAETCNVTQPSLSSAIKSLEEFYGTPLVRRNPRFLGLTPEGERVLTRARAIVAEARALRTELRDLRKDLDGPLRLGVIPTALTAVQDLARPFLARHPGVRLVVRSMTSQDIAEALADFQIDAGVSYAVDESRPPPASGLRALPLWRESWAVVMRAEDAPGAVGWDDLPAMRLCLLTRAMQNRRILDQRLAVRGITLAPVVEASSLLALLSHVADGPGMAMVLPDRAAAFLARFPGLVSRPIPDDLPGPEVALIVPPEARQGLVLKEFTRHAGLIGVSNRSTRS